MVGVLVAIVAGGLLALIHAMFSIHLRANQIVSGTAINFLALGITGYFFIDALRRQRNPADISQVPNIKIPGDPARRLRGNVFGDANLMIWIVFLLVPAFSFFLFRTPLGTAPPRGRREAAGGRHGRASR